MKPEQLSDALNHLDDQLLEETRAARQQAAGPKEPAGQKEEAPAPNVPVRYRGKTPVWMRRAAAACLALCLGGGVWLWQRGGYGQTLPIDPTPGPGASQPGQTSTPGLPMLTINSDESGGMGFEGLLFYDISELHSANPWTEETRLESLPVFRNTQRADAAGAYEGAAVSAERFAQMRALLLQTAGRLGLDTDALVVTDNALSEEEKAAIREKYLAISEEPPPDEAFAAPTELLAEQGGVKMEVDAALTVTIRFEPARELPLDFPLNFRMTYEQALAAGEYLQKAYADLIGMQSPQLDICGGDYSYYGEHGYGVEFFEGADDPIQQIVNFTFERVEFCGDDEGRLWLVRLYQADLSDKAGDYPIISPEEARELLLAGNFITTVPAGSDALREELIARTELIYRYRRMDDYYMPYYRFYIELPDEKLENGLKTYGAFYVPAIEAQYLTNMPLWDGSFN